jgi:hypothetical protein
MIKSPRQFQRTATAGGPRMVQLALKLQLRERISKPD